MTKLFIRWFRRNFSDPQAVILLMLLLAGFGLVVTLSDILAPVFIAIVLAYLLEWAVQALERKGVKRTLSVSIIFVGFITIALATVLGLIPVMWEQLENLWNEFPDMLAEVKTTIEQLPQKYPEVIKESQVEKLLAPFADGVADGKDKASPDLFDEGKKIIVSVLNSLVNVAALLVYLILVPLMLFFFMKDKQTIIEWCLRWLPKERYLANRVWTEVNAQIGNYVRGKVVEIFIVGTVSFVVFTFMDLRYSLLLGILVGFSVLIPYIGAAVVTLPIALVGFIQWGFDSQFLWLMFAYGVIQALDGNVLVPVLFSEAVNLHPVAIIIAVLFFGGIWGFWGVFFAIPLATLVKAVISAWGDVKSDEDEEVEAAA
ncbi:AI-2E family transporter [Pleionea sediminis]|uniref:AI-2E family transporter n=1 Tax=Pleionea sediminis TaxID=2569479 RepID=UPI0011867147|nr:AI-2E family transporter [Pleionea sediminis]